MKKKFKLFSTIASLCLAVALMGYGVWAATQVDVAVTSTITYTADAAANVTVKIIKAEAAPTFTAAVATAEGWANFTTDDANNKAEVYNVTLGDTNVACGYTIRITNNNAETTGQSYKLSGVTLPEDENGFDVTVSANYVDDTEIVGGASIVISVGVVMTPTAITSGTTLDLGSSFDIVLA